MKHFSQRQYIVTINPAYIRQLYEQQTGDFRKTMMQIYDEVLKDIDDFLNGRIKWIARCIMPDGSFSYTITPLIQHNLQELRKAKRRKR